MQTYRVTSFLTLTGFKRIVELGSAYGECVIYENKVARYHISCFREDSESDALISDLLTRKVETMNSIVEKISKQHNIKLTIKDYPPVLIEWNSVLIEMDLKPLPVQWVKEICI